MDKKNLRKKRQLEKVFLILIPLLIFCIVSNVVYYFTKTHFLWGTTIENVSCSFLSIEETIKKINLEKESKIVTFHFSNGKTYKVEAKNLDIRVDENRIIEIFKQQHSNPKETRRYDLNGFILVNSNLLKHFFEQIPELQKENMIEPQNAYIKWDENEFLIRKEVYGNLIDFEHAIKLSLEKIQHDELEIDLSSITDEIPEIFAEDLRIELDELNSILNSSIKYELSDGSIVTLDSEIIKKWVYQDEEGKYKIDTENGILQFIEELAIKVDNVNAFMHFSATDCEEIATVNIPSDIRPQLDKTSEFNVLNRLLGQTQTIYKKPIYDRLPISDMLSSYVEIDISRQYIWFYKDGTLIMHTPCVTGNVRDGHSTPTGVFFLKNKNRKVYLEGYNNDGSKYSSFVEYWMRFNQGIGMHDATWRYKFGGDIYLTAGSHGCVNMPKDAAAITYENIDSTIPIIVYQSQQ